jgi:hypothetical protein
MEEAAEFRVVLKDGFWVLASPSASESFHKPSPRDAAMQGPHSQAHSISTTVAATLRKFIATMGDVQDAEAGCPSNPHPSARSPLCINESLQRRLAVPGHDRAGL